MSRTLQFRRYSNTALLSVTGAVGELIVDTTNDTITVHDGTTAGGTRLATENWSRNNQSSVAYSQAAFAQANTAFTLGNQATTTNLTQNTNITLAFAKANAANILAQAAYDKANTGGIANNITNNNYSLSVNSNGWVILPTPTIYSDAPGLNAVLSATSQLQLNAGLKHWQFDGYGQFTWPDGSIQSSAWLGYDQYARTVANAAITLAGAAAQTIPQNAQSANYVLQSSDAGKHLYYTNSSAVNLYIPWTANTSWANGTSITIISQTGSSANVTILPNTGVSLFLAGNTTSNSRIVTTYGMASLIMVKANTWFINGTGVV
jgi:hypothetical protein